MAEKEKMLNGKLYNAEDNTLKDERIKCKLLCQKYNNLDYDKFEEKKIFNKTDIRKSRE